MSHVERNYSWVVVLVAALLFGLSAISPPSLMDDVDAVQAQIARNMLDSGDWVTARLDGIAYLEKAPLKYWMIAVSYAIFGVKDWAGRIPTVLGCVLLCWVTARMAAWAISERAGLYAGVITATSIGLWLFTRILIPDVILTFTIALAMWSFLRAISGDKRVWAYIFWVAIALGFLLKGLIAMVFPIAIGAVYLVLTRQWRLAFKLAPVTGPMLCLAIAAPWVILATLRNPPYFDFTMHSGPGEYHGFFWFFFLNEHLFRFLNIRYPRDYNTVPRALFWLFHLLWFFPWSVYLGAAFRERFVKQTRADRLHLLCLCWIGFILAFFTFSTTQEYYSMPTYPAFAILIGAGLAGERIPALADRMLTVICGAVAVLLGTLYVVSGKYPAPGDISQALTLNPEAYTLSLGHMQDLTLPALAYLRTPLLLAAIAFGVGTAASILRRYRVAGLVVMMLLFTQAARLAMVSFDPYLSSRPLAEALKESLRKAPEAQVVFDNQYYTFSSVFFYADLRNVWLLNGRVNNLEYGSYAPGAPDRFLDDAGFAQRWKSPERYFLLIEGPSLPRLEKQLGRAAFQTVAASGGKFLLTNKTL